MTLEVPFVTGMTRAEFVESVRDDAEHKAREYDRIMHQAADFICKQMALAEIPADLSDYEKWRRDRTDAQMIADFISEGLDTVFERPNADRLEEQARDYVGAE